MQVCLNGHVITPIANLSREPLKKRCPDCGAETITRCPNCDVEIPGAAAGPGLVFGGENPPAFCHECGEAYPWAPKKQETASTALPLTATEQTNDVFVVHGHDEEMKQAVARTLTQLGLNPIILHEQPNQGKTIIEKFEKNADVKFAVVLLSPDDKAYPASASPKNAKPRPRQNVILELGYFVGKLTRARVFALKRGDDLEIPSDFQGVVYTPYDNAAGQWRFRLVGELKTAGYGVDANVLL
jgi:predicted nucleotide-binding protein